MYCIRQFNLIQRWFDRSQIKRIKLERTEFASILAGDTRQVAYHVEWELRLIMPDSNRVRGENFDGTARLAEILRAAFMRSAINFLICARFVRTK